MLYFSFAVADSMFPANCTISRKPLTAEEAKEVIATTPELGVACNPSHQATINAMQGRYGIVVEIPATAPMVKLQSGDAMIVMSVRGLPRLDASRHEYTEQEIAAATFVFGHWTVA